MTLVQAVRTRPRAENAAPVRRAAAEAMDAAGPQVCDDMSVEVALAVMAAARTGRLAVCDQDGQPIGLVTRAELAAVRDSSAYTDHVRLRDITGDHGTGTSPVPAAADAEHATSLPRFEGPPVGEEQGSAPSSLAPSR